MTDEPVDIVSWAGASTRSSPLGAVDGIGIDPEWVRWMATAAKPRWWRSAEGRLTTPPLTPREEEL